MYIKLRNPKYLGNSSAKVYFSYSQFIVQSAQLVAEEKTPNICLICWGTPQIFVIFGPVNHPL